jgi:recombination protein RecA
MKIGVLFGNPETTSGGRALKFYAAVRLDIRRMEAIKDQGEVIGNRTRVRVKKNKVAPPFRTAEFDIIYDEGISKSGDALDMGVEYGLIEKRGSYYSVGETRLGQGRENAKTFLRENPDMLQEIRQGVLDAILKPLTASAEEAKTEEEVDHNDEE